jgi:hypothetical protein
MAIDATEPNKVQPGLLIILACAVLQGWALYGLHHAITATHWPATNPAVLLACYAAVVFVPLTVQLLAEYAGDRSFWLFLGLLAAALVGFGYHDGGFVYSHTVDRTVIDRLPPLLFVSLLLWLQLLPFMQGRLAAGQWHFGYAVLFTKAWRNHLILAEATLFTGLFWLLLFLWQKLFTLLGIKFFEELFAEPIFVYPVTALTFGIALYLIGSIERLTLAILDQLLSVLKWLGVVGSFILVIFSLALAVELPGMMSTGEHVIGAQWLLWLVAVVILLLNAAFRDGSDPQPYPRWLGRALRLAVPLAVVVSLTALYALVVRTQQYGLTVSRVWAFVVAGSALLYSLGYSWAALNTDRWMQGMARVNVFGSCALMAVLALTLTPVLSPNRLAANSQFAMALEPPRPVTDVEDQPYDGNVGPIRYLRFASGGYGLRRLDELAGLEAHPDAARIRREASAALAAKNERDLVLTPWKDSLESLAIHPAGRVLEPALRAAIEQHATETNSNWVLKTWQPGTGGGAYLDLNGDGIEEFALLFPRGSQLYERSESGWHFVGALVRDGNQTTWQVLLRDLAAGSVRPSPRPWKDLMIGGNRLQVQVFDEDDGFIAR